MTNAARSLFLTTVAAVALGACIPQGENVVGNNGGTGGNSGAGGLQGGSGGDPADSPARVNLQISAAEAAGRLSEVLWGTAPDPTWVASVTPSLVKRADVRTLAQQMLNDARARDAVGAFYRWWLNLDSVGTLMKDATLVPEWNATLAAAVQKEPEVFGVYMTLDTPGTLSQLLTVPQTMMNQPLSTIYRVTGPTGTDFQNTMLPADRAGLLTQPALQVMGSLSTRNSPTLRGMFVRERFLCQEVPTPPPGVARLDDTTTPTPGKTLRDMLEVHQSNAACAACHRLMDPIGFGYEGFDLIGRSRTTDNGQPVDSSGLVTNLIGGEKTFNGPVQLSQVVAQSADVQQCFSNKWLSFVLGRSLMSNTGRDQASLDEVVRLSQADGFNLRTVIAAAVASEAFLAP